MKKLKIVLSIWLLCGTFFCWSQKAHTNAPFEGYSPYTLWKINFDFSARDELYLPKRINEGDFYQFIFTGIDPNKYNIIINSKDTIVTIKLKFPEFSITTDSLKAKNKSYRNNTFTSLPLQFSKEQTTVNVKFIPRDSTSTLQTEIMRLTFPLNRNEYWAIGSSFYYANLRQQRFSTIGTTVAGTTTYKVVEETSIENEAGLAATLQFGRKFDGLNWLGYHLSFGPGASIAEKAQPRLLFGGGLSLGKKHNFTIDWGGIIGFVDRKSDAINTTDTYTEKPTGMTITKLQTASYFSIGYMYKL